MNGKIDFEGLAARLLSQAQSLLSQWLPGGRLIGQEWSCGDLTGVAGDSLKVNIRTGKWSDFSGTEKGGDLVSLYAAIHGIKNGEAARELGAESTNTRALAKKSLQPIERQTFLLPPSDAPALPANPDYCWAYFTRKGELIYYQTRTEPKDFRPWSWDGQKWVSKSPPVPRPLYGLEHLDAAPDRPILIVEGEKACGAARLIVGSRYLVLTWSNGSNSFAKADWSPITGRKVLLWPDADPPGLKAMQGIAELLAPHCPEVKLITPPAHLPKGWDAADCGFSWGEFVAWAKPLVRVHQRQTEIVPPEPPREPPSDDEEPVDENMGALFARLNLSLNAKGNPIANTDNVLRVLEGSPQFCKHIWFDEFRNRVLTTKTSDKSVQQWGEQETLNLVVFMQRHMKMSSVCNQSVADAVSICAHHNTRNEPRDWFESLAWDEVSRIGSFFPDCFGCEDSEYARAVSKNFWISMVARIYQPGCQADNMVIVEGAQGKLKTTAFRVIGGPWYAACQGKVGEKDFWQGLQGKLLIEMSELASFNRTEANLIKSELTRTVDNYRPSYGRYVQEFPRQCIFVGSTNEHTYLNDPTGARRFWPIQIGEGLIDIETIRICRDQLFAEAVIRYKSGENHHEVPQIEAEYEQESRRQVDEWEHLIEDFVDNKNEITMSQLGGIGCLNLETARFGIMEQKRIAGILRLLGWKKCKGRNESKAQRKIWKRLS